MIKSLKRLARVHKGELDQRRAALGVIERRRAEVVAVIEGLEQEYRSECALTERSLDAAVAFPRYAEAVRLRRKALELAVAEIDREAEVARAAVLEAFAELKRVEITLEKKLEEERRAGLRRDQAKLDELGLAIYRRRDQA